MPENPASYRVVRTKSYLFNKAADYINGLTIGDDVLLSRIYSPANLGVVSGGNARYYDIIDLLIGKSSGSVSASNIDIAYDASASCSTANISITVTS